MISPDFASKVLLSVLLSSKIRDFGEMSRRLMSIFYTLSILRFACFLYIMEELTKMRMGGLDASRG